MTNVYVVLLEDDVRIFTTWEPAAKLAKAIGGSVLIRALES